MFMKVLYFGLAAIFVSTTGAFAQAVGASSNLTINGLLFEPGPEDPTVADCWGYTSPDGRQYGLIGVRRGTAIVDVTDIENPFEVTFIQGTTSLWHDVKVYQDYAYTASDVETPAQGIQVIDLSVLPEQPQVIRSITDNGIGQIHNLVISEDRPLMFAVAENSSNVSIFSLDDPANPTFVNRIPVGTHDAYSRGDYLYLSTGRGYNVRIYNIANPAQPVQVANFAAPGMEYSHNNWLTKNGDYLLTTEEVAGRTMKMWDISDISNPQMVGDGYLADDRYIAHQVMVHQDLAFVAHYGMGLRIVDITDPSAMTEIAWHRPEDITPSQNRGFDGTWGLYVFPTGKVIHSHNPGSGLYVLQLNEELINMAGLPGVTPVNFRKNSSDLNILSMQSSQLRFNLVEAGYYLLQMYNTAGEKIGQVKNYGEAGITTLSLDQSGLTSGSYVLKLSQGETSAATRIFLSK